MQCVLWFIVDHEILLILFYKDFSYFHYRLQNIYDLKMMILKYSTPITVALFVLLIS